MTFAVELHLQKPILVLKNKMTLYKVLLPIIWIVFFASVFVIPTVITWKRTGVNPFVFGTTDSAHDYLGKVYRLMILASCISIVCYSFFPDAYYYLSPIQYMEKDILPQLGLICIVSSFVITIIALYNMSDSWRIGIDYEEHNDLITSGIFKYSRNPVFLGINLVNIGTLLIIPNTLTILVFVTSFVVFEVQVRLEEEYLVNKHGEDYIIYKKRVRRWL